MKRTHALTLALTLLAALVVALAAGCAGTRGQEAQTQTPGATTAPALNAMSVQARKVTFPADFPLEIPVADGRLLAADVATGTTAGLFSYDLEVDATAQEALAWYSTVYGGANWQQVGEERDGDALLALSFAKGGLGSIVRAEESEDGATIVHVDFGERSLVEQQTF